MELGNLKAWISVGGKELQTHGIEYSEDGDTASCWIASEAEATFAIYWIDLLPSRPTRVTGTVYVDGVKCGNWDTSSRLSNIDGVETSPTTTRKFVFANIELTDDDSALDDPRSEKLGEIRLEFHRYRYGGTADFRAGNIPEDSKVHERAKKSLAHCVKFGEETHHTPLQYTSIFRLDPHPIAVFVFRYRSTDILRADGILPNPVKAPTPSVSKVKSESVGGGDDVIIIGHQAHVKKESKPSDRIKRENSAGCASRRQRKKARAHEVIEVVDLTQL